MSLPAKSDVQTLSYAFLGAPFCCVASNSTIHTLTLDWSFLAQPFVAAPPDDTPVPPGPGSWEITGARCVITMAPESEAPAAAISWGVSARRRRR